MAFKFKAVLPGQFKDDAFRVEILAANRTAGTELVKEFGRTIKTWEGPVPKFEPQTKLTDKQATLDVVMTGPGSDKWMWVNFGTKVRYATMSRDFKAKTQVGVLDSGTGAGRKLFVSRKHPRPGIKARGWNKMIAKSFKLRYAQIMQDALNKGAARSGHLRK